MGAERGAADNLHTAMTNIARRSPANAALRRVAPGYPRGDSKGVLKNAPAQSENSQSLWIGSGYSSWDHDDDCDGSA